ncbi:MAG: BatA domain-containing protein [Bacteroidia bacterium]
MIRFIAPHYLFALSLLAIPVIIHLFNFRRYKKILFTNVKFLTELKEETTRISRLKHLLILCSRLLAVAFIVLAFAQPYIPAGHAAAQVQQGTVGIYVDNSFSMDAVGNEGVLLEVARRKAKEIAGAYPASTRFQLLTNEFSAVQQRMLSKDDFMEELSRIQFSPVSRTLDEVMLRQKEALNANGSDGFRSFIISDFQESTFKIAGSTPDSAIHVSFVALPLQETPNVLIDSCWLSGPVVQLNQPSEITVKVLNTGEKDAENVPVRLLLNDAQKAVSSVLVPAGQSSTVTFSFTVSAPGWQRLEVQLTDHPITFDDSYYTSFEVREKTDLLIIGDGTPLKYLEALFGKDPSFVLKRATTGTVDFSALQNTEMVLLEDIREISSGLAQELRKFTEAGGTLCIFPDSAIADPSLNAAFAALGIDQMGGINASADKVISVDVQHPVFNEVFETKQMRDGRIDYPSVARHFDLINTNGSAGQSLMKLQGGGSLLEQYPSGKGAIYLFTVPMEGGFSNLSRHAIFAPLLYRMALLSTRPIAISSILGHAQPLLLNLPALTGDETFHLVNERLKTDIIPSVKQVNGGLLISAGDQVPAAGQYELKRGNQRVAILSYNYNRRESVMKFQDEAVISAAAGQAGYKNWDLMQAGIPDLTKALQTLHQGTPLWKYAVTLALLFLLIEILLIRYWKTA